MSRDHIDAYKKLDLAVSDALVRLEIWGRCGAKTEQIRRDLNKAQIDADRIATGKRWPLKYGFSFEGKINQNVKEI